MAQQDPTTLETHPSGGAVNAIVNGNWEILNLIFRHDSTGITKKLMAMGLLKLTEAQLNALANGLLIKWDSGAGKFVTTDDATIAALTLTEKVTMPSYTKAELVGTLAPTDPTFPAASHPRAVVWCSDGDGGNPCLAASDGTDWKIIALGSALAPS